MRASALAGIGLLVLFQGCGGGGGGGKTAGTGGSAPGAGGSAAISQSTPSKGQKAVPVDTPFTVTFAQDINPATVTAQNAVRLLLVNRMMADMPHPDDPAFTDPSMDTMPEVLGTATYNSAARQLSFAANSHLEHGEDYHLILTGLRTTAGTILSPAPVIDFSTMNNPEIKSVHYDTTTGQVTETTIYTRDVDGRTTRIDEYLGDERTGTLQEYTLFNDTTITVPAGVRVRSVTYNGATNQVNRYAVEVTEGASRYRATVRNPGPNQLWDFTDDLITSYATARESHPGSNSHMITTSYRSTVQTGAPWSQRATAFQVAGVQLRELDATMRTRRVVNYSSLGANNQIDTTAAGELTVVDDVVRSYSLVTRDAQGRRLSSKSFRGATQGGAPNPGPDGRLFTADDVPVEIDVATYNAMGHRTLDVEYNNPGPDGNWDTATDNRVAEYDLYAYAPGTENLLEQRSYRDGGNGIMDNGAGDDKLREVETYDPTR